VKHAIRGLWKRTQLGEPCPFRVGKATICCCGELQTAWNRDTWWLASLLKTYEPRYVLAPQGLVAQHILPWDSNNMIVGRGICGTRFQKSQSSPSLVFPLWNLIQCLARISFPTNRFANEIGASGLRNDITIVDFIDEKRNHCCSFRGEFSFFISFLGLMLGKRIDRIFCSVMGAYPIHPVW